MFFQAVSGELQEFRRDASPTLLSQAKEALGLGEPLTEVAAFDHQVTGVAVTADGRRFVNFPR